jgi:hypothetical protein
MKPPCLPINTLVIFLVASGLTACGAPPTEVTPNGSQLVGTAPLTETLPLSDRILDGASSFLDKKLAEISQQRTTDWRELFRLDEPKSNERLSELRQRLRYLSGSADRRVHPRMTIDYQSPIGKLEAEKVSVQTVHWSVFDNYTASGLCITNPNIEPSLNLIWIPDTLPATVAPDSQPDTLIDNSVFESAVRFATAGARVFIIHPISNTIQRRANRIDLSDREFVYRTLFVLGRHPVGIEIQSSEALVDWLASESPEVPQSANKPICIIGDGDGALSALITAAVDTRISACIVNGDWGNRDTTWNQPISRNLFDLLRQFADAQLACMVRPRSLIVSATPVTPYSITSPGAAPGSRVSPTPEQVASEISQVKLITPDATPWLTSVNSHDAALNSLANQFNMTLEPIGQALPQAYFPAHLRKSQLLQIQTLSDHWIKASDAVRQEWVNKLDTSSLENFQNSIAPHRQRFADEVIGRFSDSLLPTNPKSRLWKSTDRWSGWELEVDVFDNVVAGGILLVPNDVTASAPRPTVVCVHGLEGKPLDTVENDHRAYHDFATKLCEQGFVVFCPQQLYLGQDRFRSLQRKANPLGKTLFSLMIPQHRQLLTALKDLPFVDAERIAFYGLSYGGKSAMRIPAVIEDYCAVICSGDFNEWVLKNASTRDPFSYVWTPEYEIFEFDLAGTFNYAEMAALICPRPFMVERGHFDGVAIDPWVAFEYAKVRHLYAAKLGIPDRTEIEWFAGPHTINGQGTYKFLHRHLDWK